MTTRIIKTAAASDAEAVIASMVLAFSADPATRWVFNDPQQYLRHFPSFVRAFGGNAFAHESAYYVDGYRGAALWLPPGVHPDEDTLIPLLQHATAASVQHDLFAVLEQIERYHPSEPHWYLPLIGVDLPYQGQGYGSALLKHALIPCDRDQICAYLESSDPKNIPFYERHGFELQGTIQVGTSPPFFPLLRKPR